MYISIIRTVLLYFFIIFSLRVMGKRQISDMQTSELVITLLISDIASIPMQDTSTSLLTGVVPVMVLVSLEILLSVIMMKNSRIRKCICGGPVLVIENGNILEKTMRKLRMTTEDLCVLLREQDIFSLHDVEYAILETNGKLSVLEKTDKQTPTLEDLNIKKESNGLEVVVINDGVILNNSLEICKKTKKWVKDKLKKEKLRAEDVFIMTTDSTDNYKIIKKDDKN